MWHFSFPKQKLRKNEYIHFGVTAFFSSAAHALFTFSSISSTKLLSFFCTSTTPGAMYYRYASLRLESRIHTSCILFNLYRAAASIFWHAKLFYFQHFHLLIHPIFATNNIHNIHFHLFDIVKLWCYIHGVASSRGELADEGGIITQFAFLSGKRGDADLRRQKQSLQQIQRIERKNIWQFSLLESFCPFSSLLSLSTPSSISKRPRWICGIRARTVASKTH